MASPVNVAEALRRSKKVQLKYEPRGVADLKKAIDERIWKFLEHSPKQREGQKRKFKAIEEKRDMELRLQTEQHLDQLQDIVKYNDVITAFNRIVDAANSSSLRSDDVRVCLVQEFKKCIKNIMDAIEKTNEAKEQLMNAQKNAVKESSMSLCQTMATMSLYQAGEDKNRIFDQTSIDLPSQASPQNTEKIVNVEQTSSLQLPRTMEKNSELPKYYSECPDYSLFVSPKALEEDISLQNVLQKIQNSYQPFKKDKTSAMKEYRFELQKAVYLPLNSISSLSADHLKDKLEKLRKLLSGHLFAISSSLVSSSRLPMAVSFCKDLLAKQIVKQGEKQVSCKHEGAFAIAAIAISLWIDFPDFGDLLLAHFHQKCPFIIPFYIPQIEGQTEEEHYKALGYNYNNGKIEEQNKYLNRMSGIMRLYSAILCTRVPHGMNRHHPHGIEHGWKWLPRILNLEPRVDITATVFYDFLETAGFAMEAAYKNQFKKFMSALCNDFFPKIKRVSAGGTGGPITRLENLLKNYVITRHIPKPTGMLPENFWISN